MAIDMLKKAQEIQQQIATWRRQIHIHPEPGFQEHRTADLISETLDALGIEHEPGIAKTGIVGHLGQGRPAVGIRADMDALEIQEVNETLYTSKIPGMMHACGHDAHIAMLLGMATLLSQMPDLPAGEVRFLFQPSEESWDEEGKGGALRMLEEGALQGLDAVLALHVDSQTASGMIGVRDGFIMAGVDPYDVIIHGSGCHSAAPHHGVNPVFLLAQVVNAIQAIHSLRLNPQEVGVISCESVYGGSTTGVIPSSVEMHGNIRYYEEHTRRHLRNELENALGIVRPLGGDYELKIQDIYPSTYNQPEICDIIRTVGAEMLGDEVIYEPDRSMAGEDFGYMAQQAPGAFIRLGAKLDEVDRPHHSPHFDLDESALPIGTALLAATTLKLLAMDLKPG
ncbi:MAG: M20 family metallopeptidase [Anaerolineales bacterium]|nr:M20 family metallopeptidase [Anaerolineales bacterium]